MVVRSTWYRTLRGLQLAVGRTATELVSSLRCTPVDLAELSRSLGASVKVLPRTGVRSGGLSRDRDGWIIWTESELSRLDVEGRFTVAHELAHMLFMTRGLGIPIGEEEYWILESACDEVATELLVPSSQAPSDNLKAEDVPLWHNALIDKWHVAPWIAADRICRHVSNVRASAVVNSEDSSWGRVEWSTGRETVMGWPSTTSTIDDVRFRSLHEFLVSARNADGLASVVDVPNGTLVGLHCPSEIVIYFLTPVVPESSLFYSLSEQFTGIGD